jgi:hypothetical protein
VSKTNFYLIPASRTPPALRRADPADCEDAPRPAINWGFVVGKTQTYLPWDFWDRPYMKTQPPVWFHDVLHADGTPYRKREAQILRDLTIRVP